MNYKPATTNVPIDKAAQATVTVQASTPGDKKVVVAKNPKDKAAKTLKKEMKAEAKAKQEVKKETKKEVKQAVKQTFK